MKHNEFKEVEGIDGDKVFSNAEAQAYISDNWNGD
jgi:hypothetical protein